ncbi:MAG: glutamate--tRNA ligase [Bacteroidales bacterium]|nr:glutamate--tRNA ligase [Bacteroidales bacterium]
MSVRVRFAPSPTGPLHIGGVRTALFNYLFAKKNNGEFILRIEDTDQTRYVEGAEKYIKESLNWLGLNLDESPDIGGKHEPYKQSERREIYEKYIRILIENKKAYYAFDTSEELDAMREKLQEQKSSVQQYNSFTRGEMKNSFTLSEDEVNQKISSGESFVVRFDMPANRVVEMNDIIRGKISVNTSTLDDKVLFKSDGLPTYHLANIVDDHLMEITHVIRGEEWLPSMPLHVLLYEAFGWNPPLFAHLPLILKPNGKGKLSKRDGDQLGFPVFPMNWEDPQSKEIFSGYKEWGYLPQAVNNMLAFLGWNPGTEQEVFSVEELAQLFDLEKVQKGGAKFDPEKTKWFNQQHLKELSTSELSKIFFEDLKNRGIETDISFVEKIVELVRERAVFVKDLWDLGNYFFEAPKEYDPKALKKNWKEETPDIIKKVVDLLSNISDFSSNNIEEEVKKWIEENELGFGKVLNPVRLLIVGTTSGPHLFDIIELVGKEQVISRMKEGLLKNS